MKCVLYSKIHNEKEKGSTWTYKYQPTLEDYKKTLILEVKAEDPYSTLGNLGLPDTIGDVSILEMSTKEEQTKIIAEKKEKDE